MKPQFFLATILIIGLSSACSSGSATIAATATDQIPPSRTSSPTIEPTLTSTPIPTSTSTPTPTPTPDQRVIDINPRDMIIDRTDLPKEGKFILVYEKPFRNAEVASAWSIEKGSKYLEESGRVDGWEIEWDRTVRSARAPEFIVIEAILFQTAGGPEYATNAWGGPCQPDRINDITLIKDDLGLGDASSLCVMRVMQSNGDYYIRYDVTINYRNVELMFWIGGYEKDFDQEFVELVAQTQFDKLLSLPLTERVLWAP